MIRYIVVAVLLLCNLMINGQSVDRQEIGVRGNYSFPIAASTEARGGLGYDIIYTYDLLYFGGIAIKSGFGLGYTKIEGFRDYTPLFPCDWDPSKGMADPFKSYYDTEIIQYSALIPVIASLDIIMKERRSTFELGMISGFLISHSNDVYVLECGEVRSDVQDDLVDYETSFYDLRLYTGYKYWFGAEDRFSLGAQIDLSLLDMNKSDLVDYLVLRTGLFLSVRF